MRPRSLLAVVAASLVLLTGCASTTADAGSSASTAAVAEGEPTLHGELTVYAAASLSTAFEQIAADFRKAHPAVEVRLIYDGSSTLATQLIEGAAVDVFASADEATMSRVADAGLITSSEVFATNTLVVATPAGNPGRVNTLADLAEPGLTVVLCAAEVPCGAAAQTLLGAAGLTVTAASFEQNVTAVLTKLAADEADAGLVYASDVQGRDDLFSFAAQGADAVVNEYPIGVLTDSANRDAADAFAAVVTGDAGQNILAELGFGTRQIGE